MDFSQDDLIKMSQDIARLRQKNTVGTGPKYKRTLQRLLNLLYKYIAGEINPMPFPNVTVSNVT